MVVAPTPPPPKSDDLVTYDEERTYREAIRTLRVTEHELYDERLNGINARMQGLADQIETRFQAMDKAAILLSENYNRMPSLLDRETHRLTELFDEKLLRVDTVSKETTEFVNRLTSKLTDSVAEAVLSARTEAQTANDALQRLLEAAMASGIKLADVRFAAQETAISKTETAIATAMESAQAAIDAAKASANAALIEVNAKSVMRYDSGLAAGTGIESKISERVAALQQLIDLRARMNEDAVNKANDANEKRFEAVNEFRAQLADQTRHFVTIPVLDARMTQLGVQADTLDRQLRIDTAALRDLCNQLSVRMTSREASEATKREVRTDGHMSIGSVVGIVGAVAVVAGFLGFSAIGNQRHPADPPPIVGENTKRVDDLSAAVRDLMARLPSPPSR